MPALLRGSTLRFAHSALGLLLWSVLPCRAETNAAVGPVSLPPPGESFRRLGPSIVIEAPTRVDNATLRRWVGEAMTLLTQLTGLPSPPEEDFLFRIVATGPSTAPGAPPPTRGSDRLLQTLSLNLTTNLDMSTANRQLNRHLLHLLAWESRSAVGDGMRVHFETATALPVWFCEGLYRNVSSDFRRRDATVVVEQWQNGGIPTVPALLGSVTNVELHPARAGMLLHWVLDQTNRSAILDAAFEAACAGSPLTPSNLCARISGCETAAGRERAWERWMQRQQLTVFSPGQLSPGAVNRLRSTLAIYAGMNGAPHLDERQSRISLLQLAAHWREPWVAAVCEDKCAALRLLATGQGAEFKAVIEAYCGFFDGVRAGLRPGDLQRRLHEATRKLQELELRKPVLDYHIETSPAPTTPGNQRSPESTP